MIPGFFWCSRYLESRPNVAIPHAAGFWVNDFGLDILDVGGLVLPCPIGLMEACRKMNIQAHWTRKNHVRSLSPIFSWQSHVLTQLPWPSCLPFQELDCLPTTKWIYKYRANDNSITKWHIAWLIVAVDYYFSLSSLFISHPDCSSLPSSFPVSLSPPFQSISPPLLFRKGNAFHRYYPDLAYQISGRLGTAR